MIISSGQKELSSAIAAIKKCTLAEGGFSATKGGSFRPDITAWALIALRACGDNSDLIQPAQSRLAEVQSPDGRIAMSQKQSGALWPTALAIFAWQNEPEFERNLNLAVNFLLTVSGTTFTSSDKFLKHDTSLRGWPWNEGTHSWVVPTSIAMLALKACGYEKHDRAIEAIKLLLDRQLSNGGWNYGNTVVFEKQLLANPECTGHALNALAGFTEFRQIADSIEYLKKEVVNLRTPLSLAWSILGLSAWSSRPADCEKLLAECVKAQERYGNYSTDLLSQIVIAYCANDGILSAFEKSNG